MKAEKEAEAKQKEMEEREALRRHLEGKQKKKRKRKEVAKESGDEVGFISKYKNILIVGVTVLLTIFIAIAVYFVL